MLQYQVLQRCCHLAGYLIELGCYEKSTKDLTSTLASQCATNHGTRSFNDNDQHHTNVIWLTLNLILGHGVGGTGVSSTLTPNQILFMDIVTSNTQ